MRNMHKDKFSCKKKLLAIAFLSFLAPLQATGTGSICISTESKSATIRISKLLNAKINVHACSGDAGSGELSVKISIDAKKQEFLFPYDAPAYSLAIDTSMDLNNDGILDLGVRAEEVAVGRACGIGRSTNPMVCLHTWVKLPL